jgi:predicted site-specific integrase-resolvase
VAAWSLTRAATALATVEVDAAAILARVADGSLRAYHPGGTARRLGDLRFAAADIAACLARVKAARGWLTRAEAQRRLGVRSQTLKCWVDSGLLVPACAAHGAQYFARASVETFRADHVTSAQAATLLGVSKLTVRLWARLGRLRPVSGPGVDGVGSYLFARAAILAWRAERLAIGEARALLGVSRATIDRWVMEGRLAPLTDMGGTKRWFARRDILQLLETLRRTPACPG